MKKLLLIITLIVLSLLVYACEKEPPKGDLLSTEEANEYLEKLKESEILDLKDTFHIESNVEGSINISNNSIDDSEKNSSIIDFEVALELYLKNMEDINDAKALAKLDLNVNNSTENIINGTSIENDTKINGKANFFLENKRTFVDYSLNLKMAGQEFSYSAKNELEELLVDEYWNDIQDNTSNEDSSMVDTTDLFAEYATVEVYLYKNIYRVYLSFDKSDLLDLLIEFLGEDYDSENMIIEEFEYTFYLEFIDYKLIKASQTTKIKADITIADDISITVIKIDISGYTTFDKESKMPQFPDFTDYKKGNPELPIFS